jgi:hypothetical protein
MERGCRYSIVHGYQLGCTLSRTSWASIGIAIVLAKRPNNGPAHFVIYPLSAIADILAHRQNKVQILQSTSFRHSILIITARPLSTFPYRPRSFQSITFLVSRLSVTSQDAEPEHCRYKG